MEPSSASMSAIAPNRDDSLPQWMERQYSLSAEALLRSISATDLVKDRRAFGQMVRPAKGSVLASPILAFYDPDPDYFFHWIRDSALVMDALSLLISEGAIGGDGLARFNDFLAFSLALSRLDGAAFLKQAGDFRKNVDPAFLQYVRPDDDLIEVSGERVLGEPRFNPDGSLDILKWSRPQHDGPAARALVVLRFWSLSEIHDAEMKARMRTLLTQDLDFTYRHWREPSFDIWEEELGRHYYTRLVQHAALADGAGWMDSIGESSRAGAFREAAREIAQGLDAYWSPAKGFYLSRLGATMEGAERELDIAVILAAIHAGRTEGTHSILDPKILATLVRLEDLFASLYPINRDVPENRGPAMGRYAGDRYYSGGAYYFSTLAAAEVYYRLAGAAARGAAIETTPENEDILNRLVAASWAGGGITVEPPHDRGKSLRGALLWRGDQFMATIRAFTPDSGDLSEQFDQTTGAQTSAKSLAWSHAAFITAFASRRAALGASQ